MPEDESTLVALTRIEGKLDLLAAQLFTVSSRGDDHETRIRELEQKPVITTKTLAAALTGVSTIVATASAAVALFVGG